MRVLSIGLGILILTGKVGFGVTNYSVLFDNITIKRGLFVTPSASTREYI